MDRRRLLGVALAVASACGYGSGALFAKSVYGSGIDWLALLYWRFLIGGLLVWAWALLFRENRDGLRMLTRRRVVALLGLGAFFTMNASTYYASLEYVSASLAALIVYIYPALVAVLSIRWGRGLHGRRPWIALALSTAGVALTIGGIQTKAEPIGILLIVASPIIYSVYIILAARLAGERRGETAASRTGGAGAETRPAVASSLMISGTFARGGHPRHCGRRAGPAGPGPAGRLVRAARHRHLLDGPCHLRVLRLDRQDRGRPDRPRLHGGAGLDDHPRDAALRRVAGSDPAARRRARDRRRDPGPDDAGGDARRGGRGGLIRVAEGSRAEGVCPVQCPDDVDVRGMTASPPAPSQVETVAARDGTPLLTRVWPTAGDPWGTILVVHGLGEHSGRHDATGGRFAAAGLVATSFDHRGFGASGGRRAYVDQWDDYLDDIEDRLDAGRVDGLPAAIYAHSLGGLMVADYLLSERPQPDVAVLSAPALDGGNAFLRGLSSVLSRVRPTFAIANPWNPAQIARDPAPPVVTDPDPLSVPRTTARLGRYLFEAMDRVNAGLEARRRLPAADARRPRRRRHASSRRPPPRSWSASRPRSAGSTRASATSRTTTRSKECASSTR